MKTYNGSKAVYAKNREAWRTWLQKNHGREPNVWLILYRKSSNKPTLTYDEAVEEALCFGWIASKPNKRDEESYYLFFARRNHKSKWSQPNKIRVERLANEGLMTPAGAAVIEEAKKNGAWEALDKIEDLVLPPDLLKSLRGNKKAEGYFNAFPRSVKRGILEWIDNAKREETREKRIAETVTLAEKNVRANQYKKA